MADTKLYICCGCGVKVGAGTIAGLIKAAEFHSDTNGHIMTISGTVTPDHKNKVSKQARSSKPPAQRDVSKGDKPEVEEEPDVTVYDVNREKIKGLKARLG